MILNKFGFFKFKDIIYKPISIKKYIIFLNEKNKFRMLKNFK